jgi:glucose-1-phosphate thymidylyltransferase
MLAARRAAARFLLLSEFSTTPRAGIRFSRKKNFLYAHFSYVIMEFSCLGGAAATVKALRTLRTAVKALVLAGGAGTRLRPITHTSAKQLVPVANKPVLFYGLEAIADVGITDVGLVIGDTAAAIEAAVGDGSAFGIRASYIRQEAPLGLAHAVLIARDFLGDDDFVMYLGDNFIVGGITQLTEEFRAVQPDAQIMLTRVPDPRNFGVAELDARGQVIRLEEKPRQPRSDLALVGVYMFTPAIHDAVRDLKPSWRGELEITEAIQWLIDHGKTVHSSVITGFWKDTGNVADMLEVNRLVLEGLDPRHDGTTGTECEIIGKVAIEAGAHVSGSRIVGPVVIGAGTRITDSYIGPFSAIGADCVIEDTEIEYSIVLRGASIRGVRRIGASLIGRHAQVMPAPRVPKVHRLVLGDHSVVQISS